MLDGGIVVSAGGVVAELVESAGAAGAVAEESAGALGEVDCCLEHATMASALRHTKTILRFMFHLTDWGRAIQASQRPVERKTGRKLRSGPRGGPRARKPEPAAVCRWYAQLRRSTMTGTTAGPEPIQGGNRR